MRTLKIMFPLIAFVLAVVASANSTVESCGLTAYYITPQGTCVAGLTENDCAVSNAGQTCVICSGPGTGRVAWNQGCIQTLKKPL